MAQSLSDEEAGRQILGIFIRNKVQASGTLRRIHFFDVRDGDFQRGINRAVANGWITVHHRDRYRYILTDEGYAAGRIREHLSNFYRIYDALGEGKLSTEWLTRIERKNNLFPDMDYLDFTHRKSRKQA